MDQFVYFIQGINGGPIKIGCSRNPENRLQSFNTGSPIPLKLLCCKFGDAVDEASIHQKFSSARRRLEWFNPTDDLLGFIQEIIANNLDAIWPIGCERAGSKNHYPHSRLSNYIFENNLTRTAAAERLDISEGQLSRLISGARTPSSAQAVSISKATDGKVTFEDFFGDVA